MEAGSRRLATLFVVCEFSHNFYLRCQLLQVNEVRPTSAELCAVCGALSEITCSVGGHIYQVSANNSFTRKIRLAGKIEQRISELEKN